MRIGVVSDAHLFHKNADAHLYKQVLQELQNKNVDYIVDCGDVLDKNTIDSVQSSILYDIFSSITTPMHIVRGNHESLSGTSLTSILKMNKNIIIHNNIEISDGMLFVPYTNSVSELINKLNTLDLTSSVKFAFSHLNLTSNLYAMIPFQKMQNLFLFADNWFNGHIHTPEYQSSLYGEIHNVGSVSSLTYGDEHIPCYMIITTDNNNNDVKIKKYNIFGSVIHKTVDISSGEDLFKLGDFYNSNKDYRIAWRVKLPNSFSVTEKENIRTILASFHNTYEIQFSYLKTTITKQNNTILQQTTNKQLSMIKQLFQNYEKDTGVILNKELKRELETL